MLSFRVTQNRPERPFLIVAGVALAYLLWRIFSPFLEAIAWAGVIAVILYPLHARIRRRVRNANLAAFFATTVTLFFVVVPGIFLAFTLASQASQLYEVATRYLAVNHIATAEQFFGTPALRRFLGRVSSVVPVGAADLERYAREVFKNLAGSAGTLISAAAVGLLSFLASFFIMLFTLFFFFRDGEGIWKHLLQAVPLERGRTDILAARLHSVLKAVLAGTLLTALLQGFLGGVGFAIFGLPSPVVFGTLMALLSLLPVGGTSLVWLPASILLLVEGSWGRGLGLAAWGTLVVAMSDNWFKPMIISGRSKLNTLPVFFGVMGGLAAFGFLGLFVGPMIVALGLTAWQSLSEGSEP
jgi:predicted PurR-regulated permease PerM